MRTTLVLNDELLEEAKKRAAENHLSLSATIDNALRKAWKSESSSAGSISTTELITYRAPHSETSDVTPQMISDLLDEDDLAPFSR